ncbi:MAG: AI-2E family transporter [Gemmatimonadales bacterium]
MSTVSLPPPLRTLFAAAAVVIVTYGIRGAAGPVSTVLLAALLAQTLQPIQAWLRAKGLSSGASLGVTILLLLVGGLGISSLLATSLGQLSSNGPLYRASLQGLEASAEAWLQTHGITLPDYSHLSALDPSKLVGLVGGLASSVLSALGNTAVILLLMVFMLVDAGSEPGSPGGTFARLNKYAGHTQQYIKITSLTGLIFSVLVTIVMLIVGTDGAVTWGVLGFFLNFVPNFGMILTVIPPVLLTLLERGWGPAAVVLASFILINFLTDSVIKPRFMKTGLNLGILESFLVLMFFGWVLGAAGTVLSIPVYLTLKEVIRGHATPAGAAPRG